MRSPPRRLRRALLAFAVLQSLAACATTSTVSVAPRPADVPDVLLAPCAGVTDLPPRALDGEEAARLWARDRQNLGDCGARHGALAEAAQTLEAQRGGTSR